MNTYTTRESAREIAHTIHAALCPLNLTGRLESHQGSWCVHVDRSEGRPTVIWCAPDPDAPYKASVRADKAADRVCAFLVEHKYLTPA